MLRIVRRTTGRRVASISHFSKSSLEGLAQVSKIALTSLKEVSNNTFMESPSSSLEDPDN
jgi:hypothetical protein